MFQTEGDRQTSSIADIQDLIGQIPENLSLWDQTRRQSLSDYLIPLDNLHINNFRETLNDKLIINEYFFETKIFNKIEFINENIKLRNEPINNYRSMLERHLDARRDRIISSELERILREHSIQGTPRPVTRPRANLPLTIPEVSNTRFSSSTGLMARIEKWTSFDQPFTVKGQNLLFEGNRYAVVDFIPDGRMNFDPRKRTDSITKSIRGFLELLDAINQGKFEGVTMFTGKTNLHMALFAQRLGFDIVDSCLTSDGSVNDGLQSYTVVGRLHNIRNRVEELNQRHLSRLEQRNQRLQLRPSFAH